MVYMSCYYAFTLILCYARYFVCHWLNDSFTGTDFENTSNIEGMSVILEMNFSYVKCISFLVNAMSKEGMEIWHFAVRVCSLV